MDLTQPVRNIRRGVNFRQGGTAMIERGIDNEFGAVRCPVRAGRPLTTMGWRIITEDDTGLAWAIEAEKSASTGWEIINNIPLEPGWSILAEDDMQTGWKIITEAEYQSGWEIE